MANGWWIMAQGVAAGLPWAMSHEPLSLDQFMNYSIQNFKVSKFTSFKSFRFPTSMCQLLKISNFQNVRHAQFPQVGQILKLWYSPTYLFGTDVIVLVCAWGPLVSQKIKNNIFWACACPLGPKIIKMKTFLESPVPVGPPMRMQGWESVWKRGNQKFNKKRQLIRW